MLKFAFALAIIVALEAQDVLARVCPTTPLYKQEFVPDCSGGNEKVLWPYYEDISLYYRCQGVNNPVLAECPGNMVFDYYKQACTGCNKYIAAPSCSSLTLPSGKKPNCVSVTITTTTTTTPQPCTVPIANYTTAFTPACTGIDLYMLWPNYYNISQYYRCQSAYNPILLACPINTYFNYFAQACTDCLSYAVAPACEKLKFDKTNKCSKKSLIPPALTPSTTTTTTTPGPIVACPAIKSYTQTFMPTCIGQDVKLLWPNYENPSEYYMCLGEGQPQLQTCVYKMYFNFYLQMCTRCEDYIPTPECAGLKAYSKNNIVCQKIK